ncbi:MAG: HD domain-containing protein [Clostridia bacterium]
MEGICISQRNTDGLNADFATSNIRLLAKQDEVEIMTQTLIAGAAVWLIPAEDSHTMEFFFIHEGEVELMLDEGPVRLGPGESFQVMGLKQEIILKTSVETKLLYITNRPMFDSVFSFQNDLKNLLIQINQKDNYTYRHSCSVMHYSMRLYEGLKEYCMGLSLDDIVIASLFHDVGKCYIPDEVLKKKSQLSRSDYREIIRHPMNSARLLKPRFGERIAEVAYNHHERLDGSGYPRGLCGDDISFPAKIVAVADVFDAMTSDRGYNEVKGFMESAKELQELSQLFDKVVTNKLVELTENGVLKENGDCLK